MSFALEYTPEWTRLPGRCRATVFLETRDRAGVIVVSEMDDNPGPSVTNSIEAICSALERVLCMPGLAGYRLVEHYPPNSQRGPTYDLVDIVRSDRGFHSPSWKHLDVEAFEAMVPLDEGDEPATTYLANVRCLAERVSS